MFRKLGIFVQSKVFVKKQGFVEQKKGTGQGRTKIRRLLSFHIKAPTATYLNPSMAKGISFPCSDMFTIILTAIYRVFTILYHDIFFNFNRPKFKPVHA